MCENSLLETIQRGKCSIQRVFGTLIQRMNAHSSDVITVMVVVVLVGSTDDIHVVNR